MDERRPLAAGGPRREREPGGPAGGDRFVPRGVADQPQRPSPRPDINGVRQVSTVKTLLRLGAGTLPRPPPLRPLRNLLAYLRHSSFPKIKYCVNWNLTPVRAQRERATLPRVQGGTRLSPWPAPVCMSWSHGLIRQINPLTRLRVHMHFFSQTPTPSTTQA